jgi:hypothetical protein
MERSVFGCSGSVCAQAWQRFCRITKIGVEGEPYGLGGEMRVPEASLEKAYEKLYNTLKYLGLFI